MQLTATTFEVENLHFSTARTTHRRFIDGFNNAADNLNMDGAMITKLITFITLIQKSKKIK